MLIDNEHNKYTTMYYLLAKKFLRQREEENINNKKRISIFDQNELKTGSLPDTSKIYVTKNISNRVKLMSRDKSNEVS